MNLKCKLFFEWKDEERSKTLLSVQFLPTFPHFPPLSPMGEVYYSLRPSKRLVPISVSSSLASLREKSGLMTLKDIVGSLIKRTTIPLRGASILALVLFFKRILSSV